jgi:two-component system, sensor histidine kinase LadS
VSSSEQRVSLLLGIFFGLTGLAVVVSALSAISLRDNAYGWYAVLVALLALTQTTFTGLGGLHLWPHSPAFNDLSMFLIPMLTTAAGMMSISATVNLAERSVELLRLMRAAGALGAVVALALAVVPSAVRPLLLVPCTVLLLFFAGGVLIWAWRRGDRYAPWLFLSFLPIAVVSSWTLAPLVGLAPVGFMSLHGMQIAVALHLPVVMVALMLRSQDRRENNRRIQGLDRTDPSTGLINGHVFNERLTRMMARSARLRHQGAVMLVDLMNYEQIQRDFGRKAAEELPLRVAERLLSTAREIDSAARLDDRRFGMLVEGPFTPEDAAAMGPRIVARCLMPFPGLHVECVAQVRIAYALVPYRELDAAGLVEQLENRLATAPPHSKRAVYMLGESPPPVAPRPIVRKPKAEAV